MTQDLDKILSGEQKIQFEVGFNYTDIVYLAAVMFTVGFILIIISKKIIK
jgi:hypothetical protein